MQYVFRILFFLPRQFTCRIIEKSDDTVRGFAPVVVFVKIAIAKIE